MATKITCPQCRSTVWTEDFSQFSCPSCRWNPRSADVLGAPPQHVRDLFTAEQRTAAEAGENPWYLLMRCPRCLQRVHNEDVCSHCGLTGLIGRLAPVAKETKQPESAVRPKSVRTTRALLEVVGFPEYADVFEQNAVTLDLLKSLSDEDLKSLGIQSLGHRKKLLAAFSQSNPADVSAPASAAKLAEAEPTSAGRALAGIILVCAVVALDAWGAIGVFGVIPLGLGLVFSHIGTGGLALAGRVIGWTYTIWIMLNIAMLLLRA